MALSAEAQTGILRTGTGVGDGPVAGIGGYGAGGWSTQEVIRVGIALMRIVAAAALDITELRRG